VGYSRAEHDQGQQYSPRTGGPDDAHIDNGESDDRHRRARDRRYRRRNRGSVRSIDELKLNGPEYDSAEH